LIHSPDIEGGGISSVVQVSLNKLRIVVGAVPGGEESHMWLLWASGPISYSLVNQGIQIHGAGVGGGLGGVGGKFSGMIRLAWVPGGAGTDGAGQAGAAPAATTAAAADAAAIEAMLDRYVDAVPVGGSVAAWSNAETSTVSYRLNWETRSLSRAAQPTSPLLMLALPHHIDTMVVPEATAVAPEQQGVPGGHSFTLEAAAAAAAAAAGASSFPLGMVWSGPGSSCNSSSSSSSSGGVDVYTSRPAQGSGREAFKFGVYAMTVRGPQVPVVGPCWLLQERYVELETEENAAANLQDLAWRADVEQALMVS
jgi:hypothetical protein